MDGHGHGKKRLTILEPSPTVGAFTVQCASCLKWRLIPSKEQYEEIRQSVLEKPFFCSRASTWRPDISCNEPTDVSQDESHLWAMDRPNIPAAPPGWDRQLVFRAVGTSKFADVYYASPSGRKLRSMPEVERFLAEFPEYADAGIEHSQFSFVRPRPLHRKRTTDVLSLGIDSSERQKNLHSLNSTKKSKGGIKRKALEALSWKESEESIGQKTSVKGDLGCRPSKKVPGVDYSYSSISEQVVKGSLPPEELINIKGTLWGFNARDSKNGNRSSTWETTECSAPVEAALQDLNRKNVST